MQELKCPNCGEVFQVDELGYANIVKQVRDKEFNKELDGYKKNLEEMQNEKTKALQNELEKRIVELDSKQALELAGKDAIIKELEGKIQNSENEKLLAVKDVTSAKDQQILSLNAELEKSKQEQALAITKVENQKSLEIAALQSQLDAQNRERELNESRLKEQYDAKIKEQNEMIEYYRDLKSRQSTKMIGESLEQHCQSEFNKVRGLAYPHAYFEKDNDVRTGSKGDYIFRETSEDGIEFLSIMFEMKNEMDTTATKHKNEDFFKELDKDRREKGCEYAVLVSLLEQDSELYNNGIVDVSYRYPKMFVVRPQFFMPLISLLHMAAQNSLQYRKELAYAKNQQIDIETFEDNVQVVKDKITKDYNLASKNFGDAIDEIDKIIKELEKMKKNLQGSENHLRLALDKANDLTIKKLTKNAPAVKEMFDQLKK